MHRTPDGDYVVGSLAEAKAAMRRLEQGETIIAIRGEPHPAEMSAYRFRGGWSYQGFYSWHGDRGGWDGWVATDMELLSVMAREAF